eukprot:TRINITY_DN3881_c0_g1_i2.p1 TRINITY_DN3881_c0_g1~~TRINITY_DN3881_c0_g1_i2.p1  ORF type:complete len:131 (-),score=28.06 TRINITY_DN3881_c0_g1_i2:128-520(-)
MKMMSRATLLFLLCLACWLSGAEAAISCVKVKRWFEYAAVCCCSSAAILCSVLVLWFLTNKGGDDDEDPWAGFDPNANGTDNGSDGGDGASRLLWEAADIINGTIDYLFDNLSNFTDLEVFSEDFSKKLD